MQINEYMRREIPKSTSIGSADIREPDQLSKRDFSGLDSVISGLGRVGDVYARTLDAKEKSIRGSSQAKRDYDNARATDASLRFQRAFVEREREERFNNRGEHSRNAIDNLDKFYAENAEGILSATKENPYDLNGYQFYFDNDEQKQIFEKEAFRWYTSRQINNIEWNGKELADYSKNVQQADIQNYSQQAINSENVDEFEFNRGMRIAAVRDKNNQNDYISKEENRKLDDIDATGAIKKDLGTNPLASTKKLHELGKYLDPENLQKTTEDVKTAVKNELIRQFSEGTYDEAVNNKFFEKYSKTLGITDVDGFKNEVFSDGQKLKETKAAEKAEAETKITYDAAIGVFDSKDNKELASNVMVLNQTDRGQAFLKFYEAYSKEMKDYVKDSYIIDDNYVAKVLNTTDINIINREQMNARNRLRDLEYRKTQGVDKTNQAIRDINSGGIGVIEDIEDFQDLHPNQKKQIFIAMVNKQRYDNFLAKAKTETGASLKNKIGDAFKSTWNKKGSNPVAENIFNVEMSERMIAHFTKNNWRIPTDKELGDMALGVYGEIIPETIKGRLWDSVRNIVFDSTSEEDRGMLSKSQMIKMVSDAIEDEFVSWYQKTPEKLIDKAATYVVDGDIDSAVFLLKDLDK